MESLPLFFMSIYYFNILKRMVWNKGAVNGSAYRTCRNMRDPGELCPNSTVLDEFSVMGGVERDGILFVMEGKRKVEVREAVQQWLKRIQVLKD